MKNTAIELSRKDMETLKTKTVELMNGMSADCDVTEELVAYCVANGCTEAEARQLITETIIPTVNEYNAGCRAMADDESGEWLRTKISERTEEMSMTEEYNYKVGLIRAIRLMDRKVLDKAGLLNDEAWEAEYHEICDDMNELPEGAEATEEMLASVNSELAEAIENSTGALQTSEAFNKLVEGYEGEISVKLFAASLWQDERMKYSFAAAACVAKRSGELESVPADMDEKILTVQCCKAMDVQNIAAHAAGGKITMDRAYKLIKTVATVAAGVIAVYAMLKLGTIAAGVISIVCTAAFGTGLLGAAIQIAMCIGTGLLMGKGAAAGIEIFGKVLDVTYDGLKVVGKALYNVARKTVIPALVSGFERIKAFWKQRSEAFRQRRAARCCA